MCIWISDALWILVSDALWILLCAAADVCPSSAGSPAVFRINQEQIILLTPETRGVNCGKSCFPRTSHRDTEGQVRNTRIASRGPVRVKENFRIPGVRIPEAKTWDLEISCFGKKLNQNFWPEQRIPEAGGTARKKRINNRQLFAGRMLQTQAGTLARRRTASGE